MHANFHCGVSATLKFCCKLASVASVSLVNQPIYLCNQDVHVHTMGCKRGFKYQSTDFTFTFLQMLLYILCACLFLLSEIVFVSK